MRRIYAWGRNKKGKFTKPIYLEGSCWAIMAEEIISRLNGLLFDLGHWFEKFNKEYEGKEK